MRIKNRTNKSYFKCIKGMEISVKNKLDGLFYHTAICAAGVTNSFYRRAKSDIWLAIPPALKMPAEWRLI